VLVLGAVAGLRSVTRVRRLFSAGEQSGKVVKKGRRVLPDGLID
jgi:hypothetical protein